MTDDAGWSARMSAKAKAREDAQREAVDRPWVEFVEARDSHSHAAHGNGTFDAATGRLLGVYSVVVEEDAPPPPDVCPVCRDFPGVPQGGGLSAVSDDRYVIQCNYTESTKIATAGARAYVRLDNPGNGHDRIMVLVRSRGGRWILKWEATARLGNFRVKTLPPEHPFYDDDRVWPLEQERAAELAAILSAA